MADTFIQEVKRLSGLTDPDRRLLAELKPVLEAHASQIVDAFYGHLEQFERTHHILHARPGRIEMLKGHLRKWLVGLAVGEYDQAYQSERYRIGARHVEVRLEPRFVIAAMAFCRAQVAAIFQTQYGGDPQRDARWMALDKVMDIDLNIMLQSYDDKRVQQFLEATGFSKELLETFMANSSGDGHADPDTV